MGCLLPYGASTNLVSDRESLAFEMLPTSSCGTSTNSNSVAFSASPQSEQAVEPRRIGIYMSAMSSLRLWSARRSFLLTRSKGVGIGSFGGSETHRPS